VRVLGSIERRFGHKNRKKHQKLSSTCYKRYRLRKSSSNALDIMASIEKLSRKKCLDNLVRWFYKSYKQKVLNKGVLFPRTYRENTKIKEEEIHFKACFLIKETDLYIDVIAANEKMTKKDCLDYIVRWCYSLYIGNALKENSMRRQINELLPKGVKKIRPSKVISFMRKGAVEAGLGS
jgi:hypothetical protein